VSLGFTVELRAPAPETWRAMMRAGFEVYTNWARTTELALFSSAPQAAIEHGIRLVFWGEHPGLQLGDMGTMGNSYWDANNLRSLNTLNNGDISWLEKRGFTYSQLISYRYPSPKTFEEHALQIVYLGVFWDDWNLVNNGAFAALEGLETRSDVVRNTGDLYGVTSLDEDWVTLNQLIKYYKYGFGRVTDYVNEDIRRQRLTRQEGIKIVVPAPINISRIFASTLPFQWRNFGNALATHQTQICLTSVIKDDQCPNLKSVLGRSHKHLIQLGIPS
jgi:hypothetical protein